jgi:hypothetical protein
MPKLEEKPATLKREHPALQNMKMPYLLTPQPWLGNCSFLFLLVFVFSRVGTGTVPILCAVVVLLL